MDHPASGRTVLRLLGGLAVAAVLAGCAAHDPKAIASLPAGAAQGHDLAELTSAWGQRYIAHPDDTNAARNYAAGLDASGQQARALAVLAAAARQHPHDPDLLAAYGLDLAKAGRDKEAMAV